MNFELRAIDDEPQWLDIARGWAKKRRVYRYHNFQAKANSRHFGVFVDSELVTVVTVHSDGRREFMLGVTSPPRSDLQLVADATYQVGWQLFRDLGASAIYALSPTIGNRIHLGSRRLCLMCGLRPTDYEETDEHGMTWREFKMTREDWLRSHQ